MVSGSKKKLINLSFAFVATCLLISCGGGGGGGGGGSSSSVSTSCTTSTSSYCTSELNNQYGLVTTKAYAAYDRGYNGDGIKVAVLDGGFDTGHSDLDGNIITGYDDEDDNNTPNADSHNSTMGGHGTHVAGIIAAEKNNTGMHGVAYNASIMPIKVFKDNGTFVSGGINNSIDYATDNGAIALNNSWGTRAIRYATCGGLSCYTYRPAESTTGGFTAAERTAWAGVATDNNVVVFSAGNDGNNSETGKMPFYYTSNNVKYGDYSTPGLVNTGVLSYSNRSSQEAQYGVNASAVAENWINVIAVDNTNTITSFSNGCGNTKAYCIAAPGKDINSTVPTALDSDGYDEYDGTSMAAPHVAAAVAVLKHEYPNLTGAQIVDLLLDNATDLGDSGIDEVYGVGLLNLDAATAPSGLMSFAISDSHNNLNKFDISNSNISFSNIFSKNIIQNHNFLGVVDEYNRVYSLKLNDHTAFAQENKDINKDMFITSRKEQLNEVKISKNSYIRTANYAEEEFIDYFSFNFSNNKNPYYQFVTPNNNTIQFDDNYTKTSVLISQNQSKGNFDYLLLYKPKKNKNFKLNFGLLSEESNFLGTKGVGIFENHKNTKTYFVDYEGKLVADNFDILLDFSIGNTLVNFKNESFVDSSALVTSEYAIGVNKNFEKQKLKSIFGFSQPLSIVDGSLYINTISGYDSGGNYTNRLQEIDLKDQNIYFYSKNKKFIHNNSFISFDVKANDKNYNVFTNFTLIF